MKRLTWTLGIVISASFATAFAQPPGAAGGRIGPVGSPSGGPGGGPNGGRPPMPVIEVLDTDHDRVISANELKNATTALLTLDKNHDGKLTENEFGPQAGGQGGRGQGGPATGGRTNGIAGRRPQQGGPPGPRERGPGRPDGGQNEGSPRPDPAHMVAHAMEFDFDKDGKLSQDELKKFAEAFEQVHQGR